MTIEQLLAEAAKANGWHIDEEGCIRNSEGLCPIAAAAVLKGIIVVGDSENANERALRGEYDEALSLTSMQRLRIILGADGRVGVSRHKMLRRLGLMEDGR